MAHEGEDAMDVDTETPVAPTLESHVMEALKNLKFRNYYPRDEALRVFRAPPLPDYTVEITARFDKLASSVNDDKLLAMAPKKPNWDLKRDVEKRLDVLERQTQRAILELIKEKMNAKND